jgi:hypothetical protein
LPQHFSPFLSERLRLDLRRYLIEWRQLIESPARSMAHPEEICGTLIDHDPNLPAVVEVVLIDDVRGELKYAVRVLRADVACVNGTATLERPVDRMSGAQIFGATSHVP